VQALQSGPLSWKETSMLVKPFAFRSIPAVNSVRWQPGRAATLLLACTLLLGACGSSGTQGRGSRDVLTAEEISRASGMTAYDVVQQLRPQFLRIRTGRSVQGSGQIEPVIYVDNIRSGGLAALRDIRAESVEEIRYIGASDATTRFGTGHMAGAILVRLRT
jgi:hypothetical protein